MRNLIKSSPLFFIFTFFMCLNTFFPLHIDAQQNVQPVLASISDNYTFETIEVPGVDSLSVTASSDFEDYAGYTRSADGEKDVAFTLIDGVFTTYEFPDAQNTYFFALGNNGNAAGHYEDSDGLFHGVVLENGELRQYDFPGSIQTEIYGISDATGALTGNFTDESGVRRGFSADEIIEVPGATETFTDFVNASGGMVGSYIDADGIYHPYVRTPNGRFVSLDLPNAEQLEYFFVHGINDSNVVVARIKRVDDLPGTLVGTFQGGLKILMVPDSVSTEGYNINQDGSIVGHYETADGRRHGFIAKLKTDTDEPGVDIPVPTPTPTELNYTFESINVPGVDFLAVTASNDFDDYAGYTRNADGKEVAFTLISDVFTTYDFPDSQKTHFYALGNDGRAAGHYQDSDGLFHGVILENGELTQYDFPNAVQTEIYGISDATGALTGHFIDDAGTRKGFSGDIIIEATDAQETFAYFVNTSGRIVGSYISDEGVYHPYMRQPNGRIISLDLPQAESFEYFYVHGINDAGTLVGRSKRLDDIVRTSVGSLQHGLRPLVFPGSVSTEGWNINQDGSVVGNYNSADGRKHVFIARPATKEDSDRYANIFNLKLLKGLNMLSLPLATPKPVNARAFAGLTSSTMVIALDADNQKFVGWTPDAPDNGFQIEGGQGYIVNVTADRDVAFVGAEWRNETDAAAAPSATEIATQQQTWAFIVSGHLDGKQKYDGYHITVKNLRTQNVMTTQVKDNYFAAATADLRYRSVVQVGDTMQLIVTDSDGNIASDEFTFEVTPPSVAEAFLSVTLDSIGTPKHSQLLQNYPNPFNPETWIPYRLSEDSNVSITIYDATGSVVQTLSLGFQSVGFYQDRGRAAYWDGKNASGEKVASGLYFYQLTTEAFQQTRRLIIVK